MTTPSQYTQPSSNNPHAGNSIPIPITRPGNWRNVSSQHPCPICGGTDYCTYSVDGEIVGCRRISDGAVKIDIDKSGKEIYKHVLVDRGNKYLRDASTKKHHPTGGADGLAAPGSAPSDDAGKKTESESEPAPVEMADADSLHRIYSAILSRLPLNDSHRQNLIDRGIPEREIKRRGYRSWPIEGRSKIAKAAIADCRDIDPRSVPGLVLKDSTDKSTGFPTGKKYWSLGGGAGLAIPVRNAAGKVVAVKIRGDNPTESGKYHYLSSNKHGGLKAPQEIHVPLLFDAETGERKSIRDAREIRVSEGEIKADVATILSGTPTVSIPGVGAWSKFMPFLRDTFGEPKKGPENFDYYPSVIISMDSDADTNKDVAAAVSGLVESLYAQYIFVSVERWDGGEIGKGIDDALFELSRRGVKDFFVGGKGGVSGNAINASNSDGDDYATESGPESQPRIRRIFGQAARDTAVEIVEAARKSNPSEAEKRLDMAKNLANNFEETAKERGPEIFSDVEILRQIEVIHTTDTLTYNAKIKPVLKKAGMVRAIEDSIKHYRKTGYFTAAEQVAAEGASKSSARIVDMSGRPVDGQQSGGGSPGSAAAGLPEGLCFVRHALSSYRIPDAESSKYPSNYDKIPSSLVVPPGYSVSPEKITRIPPGDYAFPETVTTTPIFPIRRHIDMSTGEEQLELTWWDHAHGRWGDKIIPRTVAASSREIVCLSGSGVGVDSNTCSALTGWVSAFLAANITTIPVANVTNSMGWVHGTINTPQARQFVVGNTVIKKTASDGGDSSASFDPVRFWPIDKGDGDFAEAMIPRGSANEWVAAMRPVQHLPVVRLVVYASLAAPLLSLLDCNNFIVDISQRTSRGKTILLRLAASIWGNPDESSKYSYLRTWDTTRVGLERAAATLCNLPLIVDDSKRATQKNLIRDVIYNFTSGHSKTRGSLKSIQIDRHWRTVLISSGEQPLADYSEDEGTRARILSLWCGSKGPFESDGVDGKRLVDSLDRAVRKNYGAVGQKFIQWVINNPDAIQGAVDLKDDTEDNWGKRASKSSVLHRISGYLAALDAAAMFARDALGWPDCSQAEWDRLWEEYHQKIWEIVSPAAKMADRAGEAAEMIWAWCTMNEGRFFHRGEGSEFSGGLDDPNTEYKADGRGVIDCVGIWDYNAKKATGAVAITKSVLLDLLERNGYYSRGVLRAWRDAGFIEVDKCDGGVRLDKRVRIGKGNIRAVVLNVPAMLELGASDKGKETKDGLF